MVLLRVGASFAPAPRDSSFTRLRAPGFSRLPPPAVFPPSERGPHSGALVRTAAGQIEGGICAAATRDLARSASRSRDRGSCCAPPGSRRSGSSCTTASLGSPRPDRHDAPSLLQRAFRTAALRDTVRCLGEGRLRARPPNACSCNPWHKKSPVPQHGRSALCRLAITSDLKQKRRLTPTLWVNQSALTLALA